MSRPRAFLAHEPNVGPSSVLTVKKSGSGLWLPNLLFKRKALALSALLVRGMLVLAGLLWWRVAQAATYIIPPMAATPFGNCLLVSGTTYSCSSGISLGNNDTVNLDSNLTLNIPGNGLNIGNNVTVNSNGFTFQINASEDVDIGNAFHGQLSISAPGKTINLGAGNGLITGNLAAGTINIGSSTTVDGACTPANARCTGGVSAPTVVTSAASSISTTGATLNASVTANGASTAVTFDYGTSSASYTSTGLVGTGSPVNTTGTPSYNLSGLTCGTSYFFRAKGSNSSGTSYGGELSFATLGCAAGVFDAYESTYNSANAFANAARIKTHVASNKGICVNAGVCTLTVGSFNSAKTALNTSFTGPVLIEIVDVTTGNGCSSASVIATVVASQTLSGSGQTNVTLPAVVNSYANARIRFSYPASGPATAQNCSVDNFAIRPSSFASVNVKDASWSTAGSTNTLSNVVLATTMPVHKAGRPFSLNASAVNAFGSTTSNYTGSPTAVLTACSSGTACVAMPGTLTLGSAFAAGVLASNTASYNDVGAFSLTLQDSNFAAVDAEDSSSVERNIASGALDVGRFVPDHFDTAVSEQGCSTFTYSGQPLTLFTVTAKNASGNTLVNYAISGLAQTLTLSDANGVAGAFKSASVASSSFSAGVSSSSPTFTFTALATAPSIIRLRAVDVDSVSSATGTDSTSATAVEGNSTIVSGRVKLLNAYGSERLALPLIMTVEYFDTASGTAWRRGTSSFADTCTSLTAANFAFFTTASSCTSAVSSCITALSLSATATSPYKSPWSVSQSATSPSAAGNMCITLNLDGSAPGSQCAATGSAASSATSANSPWLKYPWAGAAAINPVARATFGIFKSPLIYRRENY